MIPASDAMTSAPPEEDDFAALRSLVADQLSAGGAATGGADAYAVSLAIDHVETSQGRKIPPQMQARLMHALVTPGARPATVTPTPSANRTAPTSQAATPASMPNSFARRLNALSREILPEAIALLDFRALADLPPQDQRDTIRDAVLNVSKSHRLDLNGAESAELVGYVIDDMMGFGPLERLLSDDSISDIMVNGPRQVYIEQAGRLHLTDVSFRDNQHVTNIATRIISLAGRRVDESSPLVDARLPDGSRINVTLPPLALDGPTMTIRKFPRDNLALSDLVDRRSLSPRMADLLRIAARLRLNILISGGTGSGKTTLLNAISREIPETERIVTIEDAAELRLQQPHVVRLETRPPTIEGTGEITMRHLFRNALRMRPDRIIIGEVRSDEALDLLQAMNTGHDGSMSTLHANTPREALTRMENMIAMSGIQLPSQFVRQQLKDAIHLVVQISRQRDGVRRITSISEIVGIEGEVVSMQELFRFRADSGRGGDEVSGRFESCGTTPAFVSRAAEHGLEGALRATIEG